MIFLDILQSNTKNMIYKSLDYLWQKQRIISENIANIDTPGYKAKYVTFEDELRKSLADVADMSGNATKSEIKNAIEGTRMNIQDTQNEVVRLDGNNVNIDTENTELARTQIQYQTLVELLARDQRMRSVIRDAR